MFAWVKILASRLPCLPFSAIFAVKTIGFDEIKTIKSHTSSFYTDDFMIVYQYKDIKLYFVLIFIEVVVESAAK